MGLAGRHPAVGRPSHGHAPERARLETARRQARRSHEPAAELAVSVLLAAREVGWGSRPGGEGRRGVRGERRRPVRRDAGPAPLYLAVLGWAECVLGRLPGAESHLNRAAVLTEAARDTHLLPGILSTLAIVRFQSGRLAEAHRTAAGRATRRGGSPRSSPCASSTPWTPRARADHARRAQRPAGRGAQRGTAADAGHVARPVAHLDGAVAGGRRPRAPGLGALGLDGHDGLRRPRTAEGGRRTAPAGLRVTGRGVRAGGRPDPAWADGAEAAAAPPRRHGPARTRVPPAAMC
ncbi:hypothetical protein NKH77_47225 [Streptomyces sp. M19]